MGAWIEITTIAELGDSMASHPMWVRGLKSNNPPNKENVPAVAPYVGAWIEIGLGDVLYGIFTSHPMWVRGLKFIWVN